MPKPLRVSDGGVILQVNPMRARPAAAAAMANALAAWNLFEGDLVAAYAIAMGFYLPKTSGFEPPSHPLAYQIFDKLSSLGARLDLLHGVLEFRAPDLLTDFNALRPKIRKVAGKRALVAHGIWGTSDRFPNEVILCPAHGVPSRWSVQDFDNLSDSFISLRGEFASITRQLIELARARDPI